MNYSYIPQKIIVKLPLCNNIQICPKCGSKNSFPLMNMDDSPRYCNQCKNKFKPQISGYKE